MAENARHLQRLMTVLEERGVEFLEDDIEWAFRSTKTRRDLTDWIDQYLGDETLLSKEELVLYSKLESTGVSRAIESNHDLSVLKPLSEQDLNEAIKALESSTAAIEQHNETLKLQREALAGLIKNADEINQDRSQEMSRRTRRRALENDHMAVSADELAENVTTSLSSLQQTLWTSWNVGQKSALDLFQSDDRSLIQLEVFLKMLTSKDDDKNQVEEAKCLTNTLSDLTSKLVRTHLDRVFLEAYSQAQDTEKENSVPGNTEEMEWLKSELESLYPEIDSVAVMSAQKQYEEPLVDQINRSKGQQQARESKISHHLSTTLQHLTLRLEEFMSRLQKHQSLRDAVGKLADQAAPELVPGRSSGSLVVTRTESAQHEAKDTSGVVEQLLRRLGLSADYLKDFTSTEGSTRLVGERRLMLQNQSSNIESAIQNYIVQTVEDAAKAVEKIYPQLYSDSHDCRIRLVDENLLEGFEALEDQIRQIGERMAQVDMEAGTRKDVKRDQFIRRWSRAELG